MFVQFEARQWITGLWFDVDYISAKAVFGDLNTSEGRQLRKRAEPPKVEKKTTPARKASTVSVIIFI